MKQDKQKPVIDFYQRDNMRFLFLKRHGLEAVIIEPILSDASFRRYYRLPQKKLLVMDSPPELYPTKNFSRIANMLVSMPRTRVPNIIAEDHQAGFLLIEDVGKNSLTYLLKTNPASEANLYQQAVESLFDVQIWWHEIYDSKLMLPVYDEKPLLDEALLLPMWYVPEKNAITPDKKMIEKFSHGLSSLYHLLMNNHAPPFLVFVHRDFHVDNLLLVDDKMVWLDFQDALIGHPTYDVMSLLEDARRDIDGLLKQTLWQNYLLAWQKKFPTDINLQDNFNLWFYFLGLVRHAKVLGIFIRLEKRDEKKNYYQHLPRVLKLLQNCFFNLTTAVEKISSAKPLKDSVKQIGYVLEQWRLL
ncbi:MAG: aminoglycoside phosphotransferase family protein [Alphaproteobacteria bacterium]